MAFADHVQCRTGTTRRLSRTFRGTKPEATAELQRFVSEIGAGLLGGSTARDNCGFRRDSAWTVAEGIGEHSAGHEALRQRTRRRARRDDPTRALTVRFDSGFWNNDTIVNLGRLDVRYTMAIRTNVGAVQATIATIPETDWQAIDYTCDGEAQVAECDYTSGSGKKRVSRRLVVRRTRLTGKAQQKLWPD